MSVADPAPHDSLILHRTERTLRLVKRCRRALIRATHEAELLDEVCRAAAEDGGYLLSWVGIAEHDRDRSVRLIAHAGEKSDYLAGLQVRWDDSPRGQGPAGTAIRTRQTYWVHDIATDPRMLPWRDEALANGLRSAIALPMLTDDGVVGAWLLYSRQPDAFDAEEIALLQELAADLAFGLNTLRARAALRTMAEVVAQSPSVVVITDLEGRIEYVNPRFTELTGYAPKEVIGQNPRVLKSGHTPAAEYERLWRTVTTGGRWTGEFHQRRKDGSTYVERADILPLHDAYGSIVKYVKLAEDLSERTALEQQLRQAQKMEAVGRLAGGIAHDFNNLLTAMQGFTELALTELAADNHLRVYLEEVMKAAERASALTRQLLAFSRKKPSRPEQVDVVTVLRDTEPMLRRLVGEDIRVVVDAPGEACPVLAEPGHLEQILLNLVVNARDAMPQGGRIELAVRSVRIDDTAGPARVELLPGEYVRVDVRDTGHGMDNATMARIFEPFYTTKPEGRGTGLGLSTVYGIVHQGNGTIDVQSTPGAGSTFHVWWPRAEPPAAAAAGTPQTPQLQGRGTVLVVDDDAAVCQLATRLLIRAGYEVLSATSPTEAMTLSGEHEGAIDLLVTDVVMPELSGRELARQLLAQRHALKVLYMSGYTDDILLEKDAALGEVHLLRKPFPAASLVAAVQQVLTAAPPQ